MAEGRSVDGSPYDIATSLLTESGEATLWSNLGDWSAAETYEAACRALAMRVGRAAGLAPGDRVLDLATGFGGSVDLWVKDFGVSQVDAVDVRPACIKALRKRHPQGLGLTLAHGIEELTEPSKIHLLPDGCYDAVVSVDAAYHVADSSAFFRIAGHGLRPGGRLAWSTLVRRGPKPQGMELVDPRGEWLWLRAARILPASVPSVEEIEGMLASLGLSLGSYQLLDREVLAGFGRFVERQRQRIPRNMRWSPDWLKIEATALLAKKIARGQCLAYAVFSAERIGPHRP